MSCRSPDMLTETSGFLIFPCGVAGSIAAYSAVERAVNEHLLSFIGKFVPGDLEAHSLRIH